MNLARYNFLKRYRATERISLGNYNHVIQLRDGAMTTFKLQKIHNAQLANLNARLAVLESALNLTHDPTNPTTIFVQRPRKDC